MGKQGLGIAGTDAARTTAIESRQDAISKILKQGGLEKKDEKTGKTFIEQLSSEQRLSLENEMRKLWYDRSKQGLVRSEEHTAELQSLMRISYADFCLKKN